MLCLVQSWHLIVRFLSYGSLCSTVHVHSGPAAELAALGSLHSNRQPGLPALDLISILFAVFFSSLVFITSLPIRIVSFMEAWYIADASPIIVDWRKEWMKKWWGQKPDFLWIKGEVSTMVGKYYGGKWVSQHLFGIKNQRNKIQILASPLSSCGVSTHLVGFEGQMSKHRSVKRTVTAAAWGPSVSPPEKR